MANVPGEPVKLGPWPKGMNTRASEQELAGDELRLALNSDITNEGHVRRRLGYTPVLEAGRCRSVFGYKTTFLFVMGADLYRGLPPSHALIRAGVGARPMAYVEVNDEIYYSNGLITGKIDENGVLRPWGVPAANPAPVATASLVGGMYAGQYTVGVSYSDDRGEEGGVSYGQPVDVPAGGGIDLTGIPTSSDPTVTSVNIYLSKVNDDQVYKTQTLPNGTTSSHVNKPAFQLRSVQTDLVDPFPPCTQLGYYNGRIYGADGRFLWYTDALRYGLTKLRFNFVPFASEIDVFRVSVDGLYIAAGNQTWWLGGGGPEDFKEAKVVLPFGAVRGTGVDFANGREVAWFSKNGWIVGKPDGAVEQITDARVAVPEYASGAALFREQRGVRQLINAVAGATASTFVAADFPDADLVRSA